MVQCAAKDGPFQLNIMDDGSVLVLYDGVVVDDTMAALKEEAVKLGLTALLSMPEDVLLEALAWQVYWHLQVRCPVTDGPFQLTINDGSVVVLYDGVVVDDTMAALKEEAVKLGLTAILSLPEASLAWQVYWRLQAQPQPQPKPKPQSEPQGFVKLWLAIERKVEETIVSYSQKDVEFFSGNKIIGYLSFVFIGAPVIFVLACLSPVYYLVKILMRIVAVIQKTPIVTPDEERGTLLPVLVSAMKDYDKWLQENPIEGFFLGFLFGPVFLWLIVYISLLPLGCTYLVYWIIRACIVH